MTKHARVLSDPWTAATHSISFSFLGYWFIIFKKLKWQILAKGNLCDDTHLKKNEGCQPLLAKPWKSLIILTWIILAISFAYSEGSTYLYTKISSKETKEISLFLGRRQGHQLWRFEFAWSHGLYSHDISKKSVTKSKFLMISAIIIAIKRKGLVPSGSIWSARKAGRLPHWWQLLEILFVSVA